MATRETLRRREYQRQRHLEHREENNDRARQWYYDNREKVLARHKDKMQNNPEYAEKIRRNARRSYHKRRASIRREQRLKDRAEKAAKHFDEN